MKTRMTLKTVFAFLLISAFVVSCAASGTTTNSSAKAEAKQKAYDPAGVWEYSVDTPDGGSSGTLRIMGSPGAYSATLETDQFGTLDVNGVTVQGTNMTGSIEVMGTVAELECQFDGDAMSGAVYLGQDAFPMTGKRVSK
ncbi:hypothetical protein [Roseivirga sp.]|uniref:hypothetical protein n=1 Tax=Roseivirga sp. TaxID=1964215 RepID=UPI000D7AD077|nr:hypothetical protein [Roseivirga sp.]MBO6661749.1 hypothetical protein [Roseivirga sp.]MBO6762832.1 hypothetical protein [Roseivirga sp.]MBO6908266.1 hypothetical protein [Roseivirga sp.]PWL30098.1 MAG: hypothetical protein DCO95_09710 [Roseivirga sp. XM-24bin3]|tara:strand:- start:830 stop:1249 length:420 start_codon:yes stop_codon:yes gene_type:complete